MFTTVPLDFVFTSGSSSFPKMPAGPTMSTVREDWVALTGPVLVTLDSMVIMKVLLGGC